VTLRPEQLRARLPAVLASYKVPTHGEVLDEQDFPLTPTGKIDRRAVATLLAQPPSESR